MIQSMLLWATWNLVVREVSQFSNATLHIDKMNEETKTFLSCLPSSPLKFIRLITLQYNTNKAGKKNESNIMLLFF